MIVARAPLRLSFGGGGTDLPAYSEPFGGYVVSSAITAACHAQIAPRPGPDVLLCSRDYRREVLLRAGEPITLDEPLSLPRAAVAWFAQQGQRAAGITITTASDVAPGSGLGSSSAMTVALLAALACHLRRPMSPPELAAAACEVEIELLGRPIGRQDQYASALGGLNTLTFGPDRAAVAAQPLALAPAHERALQSSLLLFASGRTRDSASVLGAQRAASRSDAEVIARLHQLKAIAHEMTTALRAGDIPGFGALLDASWQLKRGLAAGVSCADIDRWYALARELGAYGGKIAGAGGGGHLLLCAPPERRAGISAALRREGLRPVAVTFDHSGAEAALDPRDDNWRGDRAWKRETPDVALLHQP